MSEHFKEGLKTLEYWVKTMVDEACITRLAYY